MGYSIETTISPNWLIGGALFDWLVKEVHFGGQRVRTYWYVVDYLDLMPYPPFPKEKDRQYRMLCRHIPYRTELNAIADDAAKNARIGSMIAELHDNARKMKAHFEGWRNLQDGIMLRHDAIEFRRAGSIGYNLYDRTFGDEKAVDVKLATDMIVLKEIYNTAIIVSGDQDYVPAVQVLKDCGKRIVNVAFETRDGRLLPGGARRLNHVTDRAFQVPYADMKAHLKL